MESACVKVLCKEYTDSRKFMDTQ